MKSIEQLLTKADLHFQRNEYSQAYDCLRIAGQSGHLYAALDYAYHIAPNSPKAAIDYLSALPDNSKPTVRFHCILISRFYLFKEMNYELVSELVRLASAGHAESLIVLLSWTEQNTSVYAQLKGTLGRHNPNIYRQLFMGDPNYADVSTSLCEDTTITTVLEKQTSLLNKTKTAVDSNGIVCEMSGVLSDIECDYMLLRYKSLLQPSMVLNPLNGNPMKDDIRTSEVAIITNQWVDWISREVEVKMSRMSDTKPQHGEPLNLLRYKDGQEYKPHYDGFTDTQLKQTSIIEEGGQRTHTILAYLNSLSEGATHFPKLGITIFPEKGKLVSFLNVDKNLALEKQSYHCGQPVFTNEKWMLTKWVRSNRTEYGTLVFGSNCK